MINLDDYPFVIQHLSDDDGGGYLIRYPDFSDCISDGDTIEEAIRQGRDALAATIETLKAHGFDIPMPESGGVASGKFVARLPKSTHAQLVARAKNEGVSLNALVISFISEGLARKYPV